MRLRVIGLLFMVPCLCFAGNPYDALFAKNRKLLTEFMAYVNDSNEVRRRIEIDMNDPNPYNHCDHRLDEIEEVVYRLSQFRAFKYLLKYRVPGPPSRSVSYESPVWSQHGIVENDRIVLNLRAFKDSTLRYLLFEEMAYTLSGVDDFPDRSYFKDKIRHDPYLRCIYESSVYYTDGSWYPYCKICFTLKEPIPAITDSLVLAQLAVLRSLPLQQQKALVFPVYRTMRKVETSYHRILQDYLIEKRFRFTRDGYNQPSYVYLPTKEDEAFFLHPDLHWYLQNLLRAEIKNAGHREERIRKLLAYRKILLGKME